MKFLLLIISTLLPKTVSQELCSCSPTQYTFLLDLAYNCITTTISDETDGIDGSLCYFGDANGLESSILPITKSGYRIFPQDRRRLQSSSAPAVPIVEVTSILFLEVDTSPELNIINQDSTYFSSNLSDGSLITYDSVSKKLDYTVPLEDQMDLVPGGVVIVLFGTDEEGNTVQNTVAWDYGGTCESEPLQNGDTIGWIVLDNYAPAKAAFCPVVEAPPPTPQPTVMAIETAAPTLPEVVTAAPTLPEVVETEPPTIPVIETAAPTVPEVVETEPPTMPEVETEPPTGKIVETASPSVTVIQTDAPSLPPVEATDSPAGSSVTTKAPAAKATKLFKENNPPMSISKSSKEMSLADAKASKKNEEAKSGKAEPHESISIPNKLFPSKTSKPEPEKSMSIGKSSKEMSIAGSKSGDSKAHKDSVEMSMVIDAKAEKYGKSIKATADTEINMSTPSKLFLGKPSKPDSEPKDVETMSMPMSLSMSVPTKRGFVRAAKLFKERPTEVMSISGESGAKSFKEMSIADAKAGKSSKGGDAKASKASADMGDKESKSGKSTLFMSKASELEIGEPTPRPTVVAMETAAPTSFEVVTAAPTVPEVIETEPPTMPVIETAAPTVPEVVETEPPTMPEVVETEPPTIPVIETAAPTVPEVVETEPPTMPEVVETEPPTSKIVEPTSKPDLENEESMSMSVPELEDVEFMSMPMSLSMSVPTKRGFVRAAKLFKERPMEVRNISEESGDKSFKEMSVADAKAGKSSKGGDAKASKASADVTAKESKSGKSTLFMSKASELETGEPAEPVEPDEPVESVTASKPVLDNEESMSISMSM